jgi:hypothetical protein
VSDQEKKVVEVTAVAVFSDYLSRSVSRENITLSFHFSVSFRVIK